MSRIDLCRLHIAPCTACDACWKTGICVVQDDYQTLFPALLSADALVLASPLYFLGVSGWAKAMMDRCQCLWARKHILHHPLPPTRDGRPRCGAFLATAGSTSSPFAGAVATVKAWLQVLDAIYVGSVLRGGLEQAGAIAHDEEAIAQAGRLGRLLVERNYPQTPV